MPLIFRAYDPEGAGYPPARVPVLPTLSTMPSTGADVESIESAFFGDRVEWFASGRYALLAALQALSAGRDTSVLMPTYHCRTMIDPAVRLGAKVILFPVTDRLEPVFDEMRRQVSAEPPGTVKALVLPHYFGFANDIDGAAAFCQSTGIGLIEDCSHSWFGSRQGRVLGLSGDYAIASAHKFFACSRAGVLASARHPVPGPRRGVGLTRQAKEFGRIGIDLVGSRMPSRLPEIKQLERELEQISMRSPAWARETFDSEAVSPAYEAALEETAAPGMAKILVNASDAGRSVACRRRNYLRWIDGVRNLPHCRPLFGELPSGVVPYMFPLLVKSPGLRFHRLKLLGVPMYRWDELADSACPVASRYRLELIHLPCHQSLSDRQMDWLVAAVAKTMLQDLGTRTS